MSKKIIGDLSVRGNAQSNSKNTIRDINNIAANSDGDITFPYYDTEYINKVLSVLPVSRIGTLDYLPMSVNGSFEGATTDYYSKHIMPVIIEDDGTLVYLRPGTNGNTEGYYYSYVRDVRSTSELTPVLTNAKYVPSFFTANHKLKNFVGSKANELLFMKTNNGSIDTYTIALTNGTMNSISHQYLEFPRTAMVASDPQYAHIVNGIIYIWSIRTYDQSGAFEVLLHTISVSDVRNGSTASLVNVTGFNGNTVTGTAVTNSSSITIAQKYVSTSASDNPFVLLGAGNGIGFTVFQLNNDGIIQAAGNSDGSQIRLSLFHPFVAYSKYAVTRQYTWGISLTLNVSNKSYALDKPNAGSITVTVDANNNTTVANPYNIVMENINGYDSYRQGNVPTIYQTSDGMVFSTVARYVTSPTHGITRCKINDYVDAFSSLNLITRSTTNILANDVNPVYGSAIGENLVSPTVLSANRILMNCSGTENGTEFDFNSKVYTDIGTTRTYTYNSVVTGGTLTGYNPNTNRHKVDNSNDRLTGLITLIDTDGSTKVYGSTFIEYSTKPAYGLMDVNNFTFSGQYTLAASANISSLKTSILGSVAKSGNVTLSQIALYFIPATESTKFGSSIAVTTFITDTPDSNGYNSFVVVSKVNATLSGTSITALSSTYNSTVMPCEKDARLINTTYQSRQSGLVIAKYGNFSYIGIPALKTVLTPDDTRVHSVIGKLDTSNNFASMKLFNSNYVSAADGCYEVGVIPNVGFGLFEYGIITDYQTKLIFKNHGTTEANLDALIANPSIDPIERIVIASQDVAQGFNVYFAQSIPIFLNGQYYEMPIKSVDLKTIDSSPANKTFYVYITVVEGMATYQLSTVPLSEELYRVYIGTVITGTSAITSISTEKVTRFLTYRTSVTQRGSAIPSSTGVPAGTGTRWK